MGPELDKALVSRVSLETVKLEQQIPKSYMAFGTADECLRHRDLSAMGAQGLFTLPGEKGHAGLQEGL